MDTRGELGKQLLNISEDDPEPSNKITTEEIKNYCKSRNIITVQNCRNQYAKTYGDSLKDKLVSLYKKINIEFYKFCKNRKCPKRINYLSSWINAKPKIPVYSDPTYDTSKIQTWYNKETEIRNKLLEIQRNWGWRTHIFMFHIYRSLSNFTKFLSKMEEYYPDVFELSVYQRISEPFNLLNYGLQELNSDSGDKNIPESQSSHKLPISLPIQVNQSESMSRNSLISLQDTKKSQKRLVIMPEEHEDGIVEKFFGKWYGGRQTQTTGKNKRQIYASKSKKYKNDRILPSTRFSKRRNKRKHKTVSKRNL